MEWSDLRKLVISRYPVTREETDAVRIVRDGLEIRTQRVGDLFLLLANVGAARLLAPHAALELNNQILHGALALENGAYVMRRVVELVCLDATIAERLLDKFTAEAKKTADGLAALAPGTTAKTATFEIWAS